MKKIKKIFNLIFTIVFLFFFVSCYTNNKNNDNNNNDDNQTPPVVEVVDELTIASINDFHGAIDEDNGKYGIARLASAIASERAAAKAFVLVSGGDMFQGTALSNYDHGKTIVDIMNIMQFDAMVIGNHDFDWGFDQMYNYLDKDLTNGEANFPFLGCNIYEKATNKLPKGVSPYQIVYHGGLKIAIVGYMGYGNESDISEQYIKDYYFASPLSILKETISDLRKNQSVDIVIVAGHDGETLNTQLANLSGYEKVDAVINAHTHYTYNEVINRMTGASLPCIQAGSAGEKYGIINLKIDKNTKQVISATTKIVSNTKSSKDPAVLEIVNNLKNETSPIFERVLGKATQKVERYGAADWAATALMEYTKADIGVINIGGIRTQAFPINAGSDITVAKIYEVMPFDNVVKTVDLRGSLVRSLMNYTLSANVYKDENNNIYINGELLDNNKIYKVASIDYIFDKPNSVFLRGTNIVNTGVLFRDVLIQAVEAAGTIIVPERSKNA